MLKKFDQFLTIGFYPIFTTQVDLGQQFDVCKIATAQGVIGQRVTRYTISYHSESVGGMVDVMDETNNPMSFVGNMETNVIVINDMPYTITSQIVRLYHVEHIGYTSLRWELFACLD